MSNLSEIDSTLILQTFLVLRIIQYAVETWLSRKNREWWGDKSRQEQAAKALGISAADMEKTSQYSEAKYGLSRAYAVTTIIISTLFFALGGLGITEKVSADLTTGINGGVIAEGLIFIGLLTLMSQGVSLPFSLYGTFVIEEKFGYNKQTIKGFMSDLLKGTVLAVLLGSGILSLVLWIMGTMGSLWWLYAWAALSVFSLFTAWIYPTLLAPIFNKFTPLADGELKDQINALAQKIGFRTDGLFVMDASKRSGHGNAYFTGVFGKKRIVLFDTLLSSMSNHEVVAVLAHELGHFKLHHVRTGMIRGLIISLLIFAGIGAMLPNSNFYKAFELTKVSHYAGLVIFSLWFGLIEFYLQPIQTWFSRKNEFAADEFAKTTLGTGSPLVEALKKLREKSSVMPIAHPLFSAMYYSHPPMLERIAALQASEPR